MSRCLKVASVIAGSDDLVERCERLLEPLPPHLPFAELHEGYAATEPEIEELLTTMGASRWKRFCAARLPSSLPYFFAGLRISITYAVVGAIFAEYAGAARGLGIYILNAKNNFRADLVLAAVLVSALLVLLASWTTFPSGPAPRRLY